MTTRSEAVEGMIQVLNYVAQGEEKDMRDNFDFILHAGLERWAEIKDEDADWVGSKQVEMNRSLRDGKPAPLPLPLPIIAQGTKAAELLLMLRDQYAVMVSKRDSIQAVWDYIAMFNAQEYIIAHTAAGMMLNTIAGLSEKAMDEDGNGRTEAEVEEVIQ